MRTSKNYRTLILPCISGAVVLLVFLWVSSLSYNTSVLNRKQSSVEELNLVKQTLEDNIRLSVIALRRMAQRWEAEGGTPPVRWRADARHYVNDNAALTTVMWIDEDYVVRLTEPHGGNETIGGPHTAETEEQKELLEDAAIPESLTLTHPLQTTQGSRAIIAYVPIYLGDDFNGFIAGIYDLDVYLNGILLGELHTTYNIEIRDNGALVYEHIVDTSQKERYGQQGSVELFHQIWDVSAWPAENTYDDDLFLLPGLLLLGGVIISLLVGITVYFALLGAYKRKQLEESEQHLRDLLEIRQTTFGLLEFLSRPGLSMEAVANGYLEIILSVNWLGVGHHGGVYLLSESGDAFVPVSSEFLPEERKAATQGILDERFLRHQSSDQTVHSAADCYTFPILDGEHLFGAVLLYLRKGKSQDPEEMRFLEKTTDILAIALLRKRSENDLINAKIKAEDANRLKSAFLATMSHELRTPLNGVMGATSLLQNTPLSDFQENYLTTISRSSSSLLTLIDDILDYTQLESGDQARKSVAFDFETLLSEIGNLFTLRAEEKQLNFFIQVKPGTPRYVIGDPARIKQIIINLCSNAFKFTEHGHVLVSLEAQAQDGDAVRYKISVQDTGAGIPADKIEIIFDRFSQADETASRRFGGTGLGLAISKKLCQILGGDITVESELGAGSTFTFSIECQPDPNAPTENPSETLTSVAGKTALVLSPTPLFRQVIQEQLDALGMESVCVDSLQEAMQTVQANQSAALPLDLLIVDHDPDNVDGMVFIESLKTDRSIPALPTLVIPLAGLEGEIESRAKSKRTTVVSRSRPSNLFAQAIVDTIDSWEGDAAEDPDESETCTRPQEDPTAQNDSPLAFSGTQILVADDNVVNQMIVTQMLELLGCRVEVANDGAEAVELGTSNKFDAILMDCNMPTLDGYSATKAIRAFEEESSRARVPIIAVTANITNTNAEECTRAGMDDYIAKPFEEPALAQTLSKWLHGHTPEAKESQPVSEEAKQDATSLEVLDPQELEKLRAQMNHQFPVALEMFLDQGSTYIEAIQGAFGSEEFETIRKAAHPLKSSSQLIGASRMENIARQLESLATEKTARGMKSLVEQLGPEFTALQTKIDDLLEGEDYF